MSRYKPNCQVLLFRMSLWASATSDVMFALTLLIVKMTNLTQLPKANRQTLACKTLKRRWVCYLKHLRSKSFSHILPTLCCIVTSAGTLTLPLLSYCLFIFLSLSLSLCASISLSLRDLCQVPIPTFLKLQSCRLCESWRRERNKIISENVLKMQETWWSLEAWGCASFLRDIKIYAHKCQCTPLHDRWFRNVLMGGNYLCTYAAQDWPVCLFKNIIRRNSQ